MLNTFISDLKKSPYYGKYIFNNDIMCLYIGGSTSAGTRDEHSDFDLVAITVSGSSFDADKGIYLRYKGKKVHWYYWPVKEVFKLYNDCVWLAGSIYFKNIKPEAIIYLNPEYEELWALLLQYNSAISRLACYKLFNTMQTEIATILDAKDILAITPHKGIYHLCLATNYLLNEKLNLEFLCDLKAICNRPPNPTTCKIALEVINTGLNYIKEFPINVEEELNKLYADFSKKASILNLDKVEL